MRRIFGSRPFGSRLYLFTALAAAFLLVPAAVASAVPKVIIKTAGTGSGKVVGEAPYPGKPPINCEWNGTAQSETCEAKEASEVEPGIWAALVNHEAASGSEFTGWKVESGTNFLSCEEEKPSAGECSVLSFGEDIIIKATFTLALPTGPTVTTTAGATEITQTTAKVAGTVNPNGKEVTACKVEYGLTTGYGSEKACASLPGSGSSPVGVSASLSGLTANTTYHFRFKAVNADGTGTGGDQEFKTQPEPPTVTTTAGATEITQTTAKVAGTVNPNGGNVTACKFEYGLTIGYGSEKACASLPGSGSSPVAVSASLSGLSANTSYHFRVVATNAGGTANGSDQEFTTAAIVAPLVTTEAASGMTKTTATLNGSVDPEGDEVTNCHFEYGLTTGYGSEKACASLPGSGTSPVAVSAAISGLTANTTYHFRLVATNGGGATNGGDLEFTTKSTTPPVVTTTPGATEIAQTTAKVAGTVNPEGLNVTACKVEYGLTTGYGSEKACASLPGSGTSPVGVSASLSGLAAKTLYHFRVVATNADGTANGSDQTFETLPNAPTALGLSASEITQTSAKLNGEVNPNSGNVTACKFEYGLTTGYGSEKACASLPGSGSSPVAVSASVTGLSPKTTYHFRLVVTNAGGTTNSSDASFETLPNAPTVVTTAGATEIAQTTAKVAGTVNPNGGNVTVCKVEYGLTTSYGSEKACASLPGSGSSPVAVSASLSGLATKTLYHFRVVATNAGGTANGSDQTFETLPNAPTVVTTAGATEIAQTTAKVAGTVNPNGKEVTACKVEYGLTTGYGSEKACASLPGSGSSPVAVSASLSGLSANTSYHFRVVATNAGGTANGSDQEFMTAAIKTHTLTVTKAGSGSGSVTCDGGACAATYPEGEELTLAVSAASGSTFAGWSGAGCSGTGSCKVTLNADTAVTATFNTNPPPPPIQCVVPKLKGESLGNAKSALTGAHCKVGTIHKPKAKKGKKLGPLVVKSSSPAAGTTLPEGSKVNLKLGPKPKKKKH